MAEIRQTLVPKVSVPGFVVSGDSLLKWISGETKFVGKSR